MAVANLPQGIDVASYQLIPDWIRVRNEGGADFAFVKATQGMNYVNPYFKDNWPEMKEAGLYRGAYHFPEVHANTPEEEAERFYGVMEPILDTGDMLALDWEEDPAHMSAFANPRWCSNADWAIRFLERLRDLCGFNPIIYCRRDIIERFNFRQYADRFSQYGLWLAAWTDAIPAPPPPWSVIAFWQDNVWDGFPGVKGECDHDYFNGSAGVIPLYGKPGDVPTPEPTPEPAPENPCQPYQQAITAAMAHLSWGPSAVEEPKKSWKKVDILAAYARLRADVQAAIVELNLPE